MEFEYPDDAARALRQKTDMQVQGKQLKVIYSRETNGGYSNLYYQNVEEDVDKAEIHAAFKPFGEILQFKLLPQPGAHGPSPVTTNAAAGADDQFPKATANSDGGASARTLTPYFNDKVV